jgi:hypothetical protein
MPLGGEDTIIPEKGQAQLGHSYYLSMMVFHEHSV